MSRKWKAALAPWLAGIPLRTGFAGEFRFGLLNDVRFGERKLPRMIDQMGALALPKGAPLAGRMAAAGIKCPGTRGTVVARAAPACGRRQANCCTVARRRRQRQSVAAFVLWRTRTSPHERGRVGLGVGRTKRNAHGRSKLSLRAAAAFATSRAPICATRSWRSPRPIFR